MSDVIIDVIMTGGRRCGKTSVLAAMQGCLEQLVASTGLTVSPNSAIALDELEEKYRDAEDIFRNREKYKKTGYSPATKGSSEIREYPFRLMVDGNKSDIIVRFTDYPGEFLRNEKTIDSIINLIKRAKIIIIAIDTPHMMEESQKFDDRVNNEMRIYEAIKASEFVSKGKDGCMVIFVPLKCEKYYDEKKLPLVAGQIEVSYNKLITYLKETSKQNNVPLEISITPILTFGELAFRDFKRDEEGEVSIVTNERREKVPEKALYFFTKNAKDRPEPKYCEQPLFRVLKFSLDKAMKGKRRGARGLIIGGILAGILSALFFLFSPTFGLISLGVCLLLLVRKGPRARVSLATLLGFCGTFFMARNPLLGTLCFAAGIVLLIKKENRLTEEFVALDKKVNAIKENTKSTGDGYHILTEQK